MFFRSVIESCFQTQGIEFMNSIASLTTTLHATCSVAVKPAIHPVSVRFGEEAPATDRVDIASKESVINRFVLNGLTVKSRKRASIREIAGVLRKYPGYVAKGIKEGAEFAGWKIALMTAPMHIFDPKGPSRFVDLELKRKKVQTLFTYGAAQPRALMKQGKLDEAFQSFGKAIQADPGNWLTYYTLGNFALELHKHREDFDMNRWDMMEDMLDPWLEMDALESPLSRGVVYSTETDDFQSYATDVDHDQVQPINIEVLRQQVKTTGIPLKEIAKEAYTKAIESMDALISKAPGETKRLESYKSLMQGILYLFEDTGKANQKLTEVANQSSQDREFELSRYATRLLGKLFYDYMMTDDAIDLYKHAILYSGVQHSQDKDYAMLMASCELKAFDEGKQQTEPWAYAIPVLEEIKQLQQEHDMLDYVPCKLLGKLYEQSGNTEKAKAEYQTALDIVESWINPMRHSLYLDEDGARHEVTQETLPESPRQQRLRADADKLREKLTQLS
jgi:tetratricopeptide (TPR) repeat protein